MSSAKGTDQADVQRVRVDLAINGDGLDTEFPCCAYDATRDLTSADVSEKNDGEGRAEHTCLR